MNKIITHRTSTFGTLLFHSALKDNHSSKLLSHFISSIRHFSVNQSPLRMRFVQFRNLKGGPQRLGVQLSQESDVIDLSAVDSSIPNNLVQFLESGSSLMDKARR